MPLPRTRFDIDHAAVLSVGLRATWLHLHLIGPAATALVPRDREVLTLVATRCDGMDLAELVDRLRVLGADESSANRWVGRLVVDGWLAVRSGPDGTPVIDLPEADLTWIHTHLAAPCTPQPE